MALLIAHSSVVRHAAAPPLAPTGVTAVCASALSTSIKMSWDSLPPAAVYTVYDSTVSPTSEYRAVAP